MSRSPCLDLFDAKNGILSACESDIVALSFLDPQLFLMHYYDPTWSVLRTFHDPKYPERGNWFRVLNLKFVYISNPHMKVCQQLENEEWNITCLSHGPLLRGCTPTRNPDDEYVSLKDPLLT